MKNLKLFFGNLFIYGFGQIIAKIIPFIMLPIISYLIPDARYMGINDMYNVGVSFVLNIALVGVHDAVFRVFFERKDRTYQKGVCSSSLTIVLTSSALCFGIMLLFRKEVGYLLYGQYGLERLVILSAISIVVDTIKIIVAAPLRLENRNKLYILISTLVPFVSYLISIPLLLNKQYLYALPIAALIASVFSLILFYGINRKWFAYKEATIPIAKELLQIGIPLIPSMLAYWAFSSIDRIVIQNYLGLQVVGIYAIGNKVAQVGQLVKAAFEGSWNYFAFATMKEDDQVQNISKIFQYLLTVIIVLWFICMPCSEFIFRLLFTGSYREAYRVFPFLLLAPMLLMLFYILSSQFIIMKKSIYGSFILLLSVIVNIILNLLFISKWGMCGVAVATLLAYIFAIMIGIIVLERNKMFKINSQIIILALILLAGNVLWSLTDNFSVCFPVSVVAILTIGVLYQSQFKMLIKFTVSYKRRLK